MKQRKLDIDGDVFDCVFCGSDATFASVRDGDEFIDYCPECRDRIILEAAKGLRAVQKVAKTPQKLHSA